ncbi:MAG: hypothetical protein CME01_12695 [Geminicoccus sp.]|nr:hypothetical protein [Geminicoccus sp.]
MFGRSRRCSSNRPVSPEPSPSNRWRNKSMWKSIPLALVGLVLVSPAAQSIDIQVVKINETVDAWLVEDHSNPLVTLKFGFEGGSRWDEPGKEGTASLTFGSLNEGAGDMNAETFLGILQDEAVSMAGSPGLKWSTVSFQTPTASIDFAFESLETMLTDPAFDEDGVERMRRDALASAVRRDRSPGAKLGDAFYEALWGADEPRNRKFSGDLETIPAITREDLLALKNKVIGRNNVLIAAVGDITPDELRTRVGAILDKLPDVTPPAPIDPPTFNVFDAPIQIEFDQTQSIVYAVAPAFPRTDPDNYAARVVNHILGGGGLGSRLADKVRNELGLVYGIQSGYSASEDYGSVSFNFATANDAADQALDAALEVWAEFAANGPSQDELDEAISYLTGSYATYFLNSSKVVDYLLSIQIQDLPPNFPEFRNDLFRAVTLDDARRVAKRLYGESLRFGVVGLPTEFTPY